MQVLLPAHIHRIFHIHLKEMVNLAQGSNNDYEYELAFKPYLQAFYHVPVESPLGGQCEIHHLELYLKRLCVYRRCGQGRCSKIRPMQDTTQTMALIIPLRGTHRFHLDVLLTNTIQRATSTCTHCFYGSRHCYSSG